MGYRIYIVGLAAVALFGGPNLRAEDLPVIDTPAKAVEAQKAAAAKLARPQEWTNSIGMKFCLVPAGEFVMGRSGKESDETPHKVRLTQAFYIGRFEVTRAQWEAVMGTKHSDYFPGPDVPMNMITWYHATAFLKALNKQENA